MKTHTLKTKTIHFDDIITKWRRFELRKNDRDFQPCDLVLLKAWDGNKYTGEWVFVEVQHILKDVEEYGLDKDYCIFSFHIIKYGTGSFGTTDKEPDIN